MGSIQRRIGLALLVSLLLLRQIVLQSLLGAGLCMLDLLLVLHSRLAGVLGLLQLAFGGLGIGQALLQLRNLLPGFSASGVQCFGLLPCSLIQRHCALCAQVSPACQPFLNLLGNDLVLLLLLAKRIKSKRGPKGEKPLKEKKGKQPETADAPAEELDTPISETDMQ